MTHDTNTGQSPLGRDYWEDRYAGPGLEWSGNPNPVLVAEATPLTPGRALDIGSGEGGDALWLAARGWRVVGVDIAVNALDKARVRVESVDPSAAAHIEWQQHDLTAWAPDPRSFDLVSSQFMHLPEAARTSLFRGLAAAVAPGGTLLIVGHDAAEGEDAAGRGSGHGPHAHANAGVGASAIAGPGGGPHQHFLDLMFRVDDVLTAIDGEGLRVDVAEVRARAAPHASHDAPLRDVIVKATRPA
jgi:SAM-dependent methyltransferase